MSRRRRTGVILIAIALAPLIAGLIVGNIPYTMNGFQVCPPYFGSLGGQTFGESLINGLSNGGCTAYSNQIQLLLIGIFGATAVLIIVGLAYIVAGGRDPRRAYPAGWYPDQRQAGLMRWYNGREWTDLYQPMAQAQPPTTE